jgi:hypothetical protein
VKGLLRPCRHQLGGELRDRWRAHLCGLCLTLRDEAGQHSRALTGYDLLLLSVLVEAQVGRQPTEMAGPCPLRGMRSATVVEESTHAMQFAAAGALLAGAAGLRDKVHDGDVVAAARPAATAASQRFQRTGEALAQRVSFQADAVTDAASAAAAAEARGATLEQLLAPAGDAVGALFAHTAVIADRPDNQAPLRRAGRAFGQLVHLADAVEDLKSDARHGRFNPLVATRTSPELAYRQAQDLQAAITAAMAAVSFVDGALAERLLGPTLNRAVERLAPRSISAAAVGQVAVLAAATASVAAISAVFGGGRQRRGWDRFNQPQYDPRYDRRADPNDPLYDPRFDPRYDPRFNQGFGYNQRPSCLQMLACDCCANLACDEVCGGSGGDCCVCCI